MPEKMNENFEKWAAWFSGLNEKESKVHYREWEKISTQAASLRKILEHSELDLYEEKIIANSIVDKLKYDEPYRVVLLGQTGAGKSSLLNALLGNMVAKVGAGGAVTGVSTYIYPNAEKKIFRLIYRDEEAFLELLQRMAKRYDQELPSNMEVIKRELSEIKKKLQKDARLEKHLADLLGQDLEDIVCAWELMKTRIDSEKPYESFEDLSEVEMLIEENSETNDRNSDTRIISGILRAEFYLPVNSIDDSSVFSHAVLIDTPGIGASTLRHLEILQMEAEKADAIILVLNSNRPEESSKHLASIIRNVLFEGLGQKQQDRLIAKLVVVKNKIDQIKKDDLKRLDTSIKGISESVLKGNADRAMHLFERQCFDANSELACLSQKFMSKKELDEDEKRAYSSHIAKYSGENQWSDSAIHENALEWSKIPSIKRHLQDYLHRGRIALVLYEASSLFDNLTERLLAGLEDRLSQLSCRGGNFRSGDGYLRGVCLSRIEADNRELQRLYGSIQNKLCEWRKSQEHRNDLKRKMESIFEEIQECIERSVEEVFESEDTFMGKTIDDVFLTSCTETFPVKIYDKIRNNLILKVEVTSEKIARYYLNAFEKDIDEAELYKAINEKTYGQDYIDKYIRPAQKLEKIQMAMRNNYLETCRWILAYEFLKCIYPYLKSEFRHKVWAVVKDIAPNLIGAMLGAAASTATGGATGPIMGPAASAAVGTVVGNKVSGAVSSGSLEKKLKAWFGPKETDGTEETHALQETKEAEEAEAFEALRGLEAFGRNEWLAGFVDAERKKLIEEIDRFMAAGDKAGVKTKAAKYFLDMYNLSMINTLPYLENMFFYEAGKFRGSFESVVKEMCEEHSSHLRAGTADQTLFLSDQDTKKLNLIVEIQRVQKELKNLLDGGGACN